MTNSATTKIASAIIAFSATTMSFAEVANATTVEFSYTQAELATEEGMDALDRRLGQFAREVCQEDARHWAPQVERSCRDNIEAQLRQKIEGRD